MLRLQRDVLQFHPTVVLLLFGTNDSGVTAQDGRAPVSVQEFRVALGGFVTKVRAVGAAPVLLSLPPTDPVRSAPGGTASMGG